MRETLSNVQLIAIHHDDNFNYYTHSKSPTITLFSRYVVSWDVSSAKLPSDLGTMGNRQFFQSRILLINVTPDNRSAFTHLGYMRSPRHQPRWSLTTVVLNCPLPPSPPSSLLYSPSDTVPASCSSPVAAVGSSSPRPLGRGSPQIYMQIILITHFKQT